MSLAVPVPDPPLRGAVVALRKWRESDVPAIVTACQDPVISRWSPTIPWPYSEGDARGWLNLQEPSRQAGEALELAVTDLISGDLLGAIALAHVSLSQGSASVGYWLAVEARGRGVMTEAVRLLVQWAFGPLKLARLALTTDPENLPSQRVAERCGFALEGRMRSHLVVRHSGERRDSLLYSLLPGELT